MATTSRIPRKIADFSPYINDTTAYLASTEMPVAFKKNSAEATAPVPLPITNWQRLGLLQTEFTLWKNYLDDWTPLYPQYTQKKEKRTTSIKDQLLEVQEEFIDFAQPLLNRIQYSPNAVMQDYEVFNIKGGTLRDDVPSRSHTPIDLEVKFSMKPIGGSKVKFSCNAIEEGNRAGIPDVADAVEVYYKVGDPVPNNYGECPTNYISTKAIFTLTLPADSEGKKIYAFCRWIVLSDPGRSGPFSSMNRVVVA